MGDGTRGLDRIYGSLHSFRAVSPRGFGASVGDAFSSHQSRPRRGGNGQHWAMAGVPFMRAGGSQLGHNQHQPERNLVGKEGPPKPCLGWPRVTIWGFQMRSSQHGLKKPRPNMIISNLSNYCVRQVLYITPSFLVRKWRKRRLGCQGWCLTWVHAGPLPSCSPSNAGAQARVPLDLRP